VSAATASAAVVGSRVDAASRAPAIKERIMNFLRGASGRLVRKVS
jgi:hypothetical protein